MSDNRPITWFPAAASGALDLPQTKQDQFREWRNSVGFRDVRICGKFHTGGAFLSV